MNFEVFIAPSFEKDLKALDKKYPSIKNDIRELIAELKIDPFKGDRLGRDCYKVRVPIKSKGKGKSAGARVITCVKVIKTSIFLLKLYDKSERSTVADKEFTALLKAAGLL